MNARLPDVEHDHEIPTGTHQPERTRLMSTIINSDELPAADVHQVDGDNLAWTVDGTPVVVLWIPPTDGRAAAIGLGIGPLVIPIDNEAVRPLALALLAAGTAPTS